MGQLVVWLKNLHEGPDSTQYLWLSSALLILPPILNLSSPGARLHFPSSSFSFLYKSAILATGSLGSFLLISLPSLLFLSLLSGPSSVWTLPDVSSRTLSLISTIKSFSKIPRSSHVLIFIHILGYIATSWLTKIYERPVSTRKEKEDKRKEERKEKETEAKKAKRETKTEASNRGQWQKLAEHQGFPASRSNDEVRQDLL